MPITNNRSGPPNSTLPRTNPPSSLNIFQHNCCGSNQVFLSLFSNLKTLKPDIIAIQDPFLFNGKPLNAPGFTLIFNHSVNKPRVATYINNNTLKYTSYITNSLPSSNTLSVTIYINDQPFQIVNIYNTPWNARPSYPKKSFDPPLSPPSYLGTSTSTHRSQTPFATSLTKKSAAPNPTSTSPLTEATPSSTRQASTPTSPTH